MLINEYKKIMGLKYLEQKDFPIPPYIVIELNRKTINNFERHISERVKMIGIPHEKNDRIGVTIRASLPGKLDKKGKHGGLHILEINEVIRRVLEIHDRYKPEEKIIVQHTVDGKSSGTILVENDKIIIETIPGDAPNLLEGKTSNYESWEYDYRWKKVKEFQVNNSRKNLLTNEDLTKFIYYFKKIQNGDYLEWTIAKNGILYFYEYQEISLNN